MWRVSENIADYQNIVPGRYLKLIVADNGKGIDPDVLPRIFEPYFTTKGVGEGTGMGLATVHGIIKEHGGDIKVFSEPGTGTTFHVLLPVNDNLSLPVRERGSELPRGSERILLVDDEQYIVDIAKEMLVNLGYSVDARTNSLECLEVFRAHPDEYDLIITDFTMPRMNGMELISEIRKIRQTIPIILCTGFSRSILSTKMTTLAIDSLIMKPFSTSDLAFSVRETIDSRSGHGNHVQDHDRPGKNND